MYISWPRRLAAYRTAHAIRPESTDYAYNGAVVEARAPLFFMMVCCVFYIAPIQKHVNPVTTSKPFYRRSPTAIDKIKPHQQRSPSRQLHKLTSFKQMAAQPRQHSCSKKEQRCYADVVRIAAHWFKASVIQPMKIDAQFGERWWVNILLRGCSAYLGLCWWSLISSFTKTMML